MGNIVIRDYTVSCATGHGVSALSESLRQKKTGLRKNDFPHCDLETWIGRVDGVEDVERSPHLDEWRSRNNALAMLGYTQDQFDDSVASRIQKWGSSRVGVVIGTSTSSIGRTEEAYRNLDDAGQFKPEYVQPHVHTPYSPSAFVAHMSGISGPSMTISTACSSSAKVFATAVRWMNAGLVDAVLVGGIDTLCLSVLNGFHSLQLVSGNPCRPFDKDRDGINLGEAAGFVFLEKGTAEAGEIVVAGYGESSDAHHMSHPHPDGLGAEIAMTNALSRAQLKGEDIGYINLHGTASRVNDAIETSALARLFPETTLVSSTKGWTGHTLGAAGIVEAVICLEALNNQFAPGTLNLAEPDESLSFPVLEQGRSVNLEHVMTNSFGFGGNNCSLIFSRAAR